MATRRIPFTKSQWEELENQALVFKYLAANIPVPPHLLFLIKRPFLFTTSSTSSFCPHPIGWNVYEMGRKVDAEPGRCRRTDGKKWRCSKEASPDSKYCERHMHRGKNRSSSSRKPLPPPQFSVSSTPNLLVHSSSRVTSGLAMEDDCGYQSREKKPDRHCFILGTDLMLEEKLKQREDQEEEVEEQRSKRLYRFLDEWPSSSSSSSNSSVATSLFI
ncbi:hypothetical protein AALP_AA3G302300 [Arabis alpina]|uniref:Growth-regulating factor n=1 Tax=Arabis alpina TaxID=50452 RepID=A0A087HCN8_ARAAL|nr:hypothetical protein AALP_AA3G302300 [Arabis alpina]